MVRFRKVTPSTKRPGVGDGGASGRGGRDFETSKSLFLTRPGKKAYHPLFRLKEGLKSTSGVDGVGICGGEHPAAEALVVWMSEGELDHRLGQSSAAMVWVYEDVGEPGECRPV